MTPDPLNRLVAQLSKLPGIGEKTAQRLAFHILRAPPEYAVELVAALQEVKSKVRLCTRCFALTEGELCGFCTDPRRDDRLLCVVEGIADLMALERTREFKGRYHVLHGVLSPLDGIGPEQLRIQELLVRLEDGKVGGGHRRHQPRRRGRGHRALFDAPAPADGHPHHPARPGPTDGRRPRVRGPGDPGPRAVRSPRAVASVRAAPENHPRARPRSAVRATPSRWRSGLRDRISRRP